MVKMSALEFFDYTFLHSRAWLLFGLIYGAYLLAMVGVLWVVGSQQEHDCDTFIITNHIMDPGLNHYSRQRFAADDRTVEDARRIGCRVVSLGNEGHGESYAIYQTGKKFILFSRWFLSLTLGGILVILVLQYIYCLTLKARGFNPAGLNNEIARK